MAFDNGESDHDDPYGNGLSDDVLVQFATQHEQSFATHTAVENSVSGSPTTEHAVGIARGKRSVQHTPGIHIFKGGHVAVDDVEDNALDPTYHDASSTIHATGPGVTRLYDTPQNSFPGSAQARLVSTQRVSPNDNKNDTNIRSEIEHLMRELQITKEQLEVRNGEVATIRRKLSRVDDDRQKKALAHTKELAETKRQHQAELEKLRKAIDQLSDKNRFIQHELQTISHDKEILARLGRSKNDESVLQKSRATVNVTVRNDSGNEHNISTPSLGMKRPRDGGLIQQSKAPAVSQRPAGDLSFRDGFDMNELATSPAMPFAKRQKKAQVRSAEVDHQLELSQTKQETRNLEFCGGPNIPEKVIDRKASKFLRKLLNHRSFPRNERDLEILARYKFQSEPDRSILSIVLGQLALCHSGDVAVQYMKIIVGLLQRCIQEKFYEIVGVLIDLLSYAIGLDAFRLVPELIEDLIPALMSACLVNGEQRYFSSPIRQEKQREDQIKQGHLRSVRATRRRTPKDLITPKVSSTKALTLLHTVISASVIVPTVMTRIWQLIRWEFIYKMLSSYQLLDDLELVITILGFSIRPATLGPLLSSYELQADNERIILERVARLLHEPLTVDEGGKPYGLEVSTFRLRAMNFLMDAISLHPNTSQAPTPDTDDVGTGTGLTVTGKTSTNYRVTRLILQNPSILPHVFNAIYDELSRLSSNPPDAENCAKLINGLVRFAYSVTHTSLDERRDHPKSIVSDGEQSITNTKMALQVDLRAKLQSAAIRRFDGYARSQIRGIARRFLVSMTRIAFSERLVLDAWIDEESVNMCNEMLDECLNPQEVEHLLEIFKEKEDIE